MEKYQANPLPDFVIKPGNIFSDIFLQMGIATFYEATHFVKALKYGRNVNKNDLTTVFADNCGTCGTKHALLLALAEENGVNDMQLALGIFKMNAQNTPAVAKILGKHGLDYIPEAHNYLKYKGEIFDFTFPDSQLDFTNVLLDETVLRPEQISDFKVACHKRFLSQWIGEEKIPYTLSQIWDIREQCIQAMADAG